MRPAGIFPILELLKTRAIPPAPSCNNLPPVRPPKHNISAQTVAVPQKKKKKKLVFSLPMCYNRTMTVIVYFFW